MPQNGQLRRSWQESESVITGLSDAELETFSIFSGREINSFVEDQPKLKPS